MNLTTSAIGTAVGLSTDLSTGVIDRFRTLPIWRSSILVGRSLADLFAGDVVVTIVGLTGLVIGWRPTHRSSRSSPASGSRCCSATRCRGDGMPRHGLPRPRIGPSVGLIVLFPLAFVSNAMVPDRACPRAAGHRGLEPGQRGRRPPAGPCSATPTLRPHPRLADAAPGPGVGGVVGGILIAIFAPLAAHLFRRRTTD